MTRTSDPEFIVFVDRGVDRREVVHALSAVNAAVTTSWPEFAAAAHSARTAAVVAADLPATLRRRIRTLRARQPALPLILVTSLTPPTLSAIARLPRIQDAIPISEVRDRLVSVLHNAARNSVLLEAAAWIEEQEHLSPLLRAALARACRRREPVRTVTSLAHDMLGSGRTTLWNLWKESGIIERPHAFIDWLLVAHAVARDPDLSSIATAARKIGVDDDTLRAAYARTVAMGPGTRPQSLQSGLVEALKSMLCPKTFGD